MADRLNPIGMQSHLLENRRRRTGSRLLFNDLGGEDVWDI